MVKNVFLATRVKHLNPAIPEIALGLFFYGPIIFFPPSDSLINCLQPEKSAAKEKTPDLGDWKLIPVSVT